MPARRFKGAASVGFAENVKRVATVGGGKLREGRWIVRVFRGISLFSRRLWRPVRGNYRGK
jgi:hypothetical protein